MRQLKIIFILAILSIRVFGQDKLYPITSGNLCGYIDKTGRTVIKPQFFNGGQFCEGLAAVRMNGTYGYIDISGKFAIAPQYDFALAFQNGIAQVFIDGKPFFIDKTGNIVFQHSFKNISPFDNHNFAIAITPTGKYCLINKEGKQITDTAFKKINPFADGLAVVEGLNHLPYTNDSTKQEKFETGVIDSTGKLLVNFGRYRSIGQFMNGYAKASLLEPTERGNGWTNHIAIIDRQGKERFIIPSNKYSLDYHNEGFYDDVAVIRTHSVNIYSTEEPESSGRADYRGLINPDGKILFSDTNWMELTPFAFNRAFILDGSEHWKMINKNGQQVCDLVFEKIVPDPKYSEGTSLPFENGTAFVKLKQGWCLIDTSGRLLTQPKLFSNEEDYREIMRRGNALFFMKDISVEQPHYSFSFGFFNPATNTLVEPTYHDMDTENFDEGLIYAMKDEKTYYITNKGEVIWQEKDSVTNKISNLNIDFMNRGYFYAYSKPNKEDLSGFGSSVNFQKKISKANNFPPDTLSLIVHPELTDTIYGNTHAITVYISNSTNREIEFKAQDSRLYMKVQALNSKGEWKDIEYLPSSWCGNSYHTLTLEPKYFWKFFTPVYDGELKTKLRIELKYVDPADKSEDRRSKKEIIVYSNEYDGNINPGQFWNKRQYYPSGIMDPYND